MKENLKLKTYIPKDDPDGTIEILADESSKVFDLNYNKFIISATKFKPKFYILYKDNEIIAFAKVTENSNKGKGKGIELSNVVTVRKYRGQGYGSILLEKIKKKEDYIFLTAIKKKTHSFYKKNGFRTLTEVLKKDFKKKLTKEEQKELEEEKGIDGIWTMDWDKETEDNLEIKKW